MDELLLDLFGVSWLDFELLEISKDFSGKGDMLKSFCEDELESGELSSRRI